MNKLYWIVCEEGDRTLYEGRFLGRTRGAAMKHLKERLGRSGLSGLVFSITEIPVPLIREIVAGILAGGDPTNELGNTGTFQPEPEPEGRYEAFGGETPDAAQSTTSQEEELPASMASPRAVPQYDWEAIKACYMEGRGPKDVASLMEVPLNTLKGRIQREGWAQQRREVGA